MLWCKTVSKKEPITPAGDIAGPAAIRISRVSLRDDSLAKGLSVFVKVQQKAEATQSWEEAPRFTVCRLEKGGLESHSVDLAFWPGDDFRVVVEGADAPVDLIGHYELYDNDEGGSDDETGDAMKEVDGDLPTDDSYDSSSEGDDKAQPGNDDTGSDMSDDSLEGSDGEESHKDRVKEIRSDSEKNSVKSDENSDPDAPLHENDEKDSKGGKKRPQTDAKQKNPDSAPPKKKSDAGKQKDAQTKVSSDKLETEWVGSIVKHIKATGATTLGDIGSKVKRPNGIQTKLTKFIQNHSKIFAINNGKVSLV